MCLCSLSLPGLYITVVRECGMIGRALPPSARLMLPIKFVLLPQAGSHSVFVNAFSMDAHHANFSLGKCLMAGYPLRWGVGLGISTAGQMYSP